MSRRLSLSFVDSDHVIEQHIGCSIRSFFEKEGEERFRDIEATVIEELTRRADTVISTGGGAVLREANRQCLHERSQVIYLRSTPEDIYRRLRHDRQRPLLQVADPLARLRDLFEQRDPLYRDVCHYTIETGRPSVATLVNMIIMQLEMGGLAQTGTG
ncbi:shikimate kinase [Hydrogenophaga sp. 5NK40-0174]